MLKSIKPLTAERARLIYSLSRHSGPKATPDAPSMHPDNPFLQDVEGDDPNKLHRSLQGLPLKVQIGLLEDSPTEFDLGEVQLFWDGNEVPGQYISFFSPLDVDMFPLNFTVPGSTAGVPGTHTLSYTFSWNQNGEESDPLTVNIDNVAPNNNAGGDAVILPPDVEENGITKAFLDEHPGGVLVTIPDNYVSRTVEDVFDILYGDRLPGAIPVATITRRNLTDPITTHLTREMLGGKEGRFSIFYYMTDRVGNRGQISAFKTFDVVLSDPPVDLPVIVVPEAEDDEGIDYADAISDGGVAVQLNRYGNHMPTDQVVVTWDGIVQGEVTVAGFPTYIDVGFRDVKNGNEGPKQVSVDYVIKRGDKIYPGDDTATLVEVDLRVPGPVDPTEPPEEVHPGLALVTVHPSISGTDNQLTLADAGEDATATVSMFGRYKPGDVAQLYWNNEPVSGASGSYRVTGAEPPDFVITFIIPWSDILAGGNDSKLPVHYTIAHPATNGNTVRSGAQEVDVLVLEITLPIPIFQHLYFNNVIYMLTCASRRRHPALNIELIEIHVPGGESKLADQTLVFTFQGWMTSAGTTPIEGSKYEFTYKPTQQEADEGFLVRVPYDPWLTLVYTRFCSISYVAQIDGLLVPANSEVTRVYMFNNGGLCAPL